MTMPDQKTEVTGQLVHLMLELRDELRQFMQKKFRANDIDLTYEMHQIMACLWRSDGLSQQELANRTLKEKASMTFLIDNLSKRELVTRKEHPTDRRSKLIHLTPKGIQMGQMVKPWVDELFVVAGSGLDTAVLQEQIRVLTKMRDNVRAY